MSICLKMWKHAVVSCVILLLFLCKEVRGRKIFRSRMSSASMKPADTKKDPCSEFKSCASCLQGTGLKRGIATLTFGGSERLCKWKKGCNSFDSESGCCSVTGDIKTEEGSVPGRAKSFLFKTLGQKFMAPNKRPDEDFIRYDGTFYSLLQCDYILLDQVEQLDGSPGADKGSSPGVLYTTKQLRPLGAATDSPSGDFVREFIGGVGDAAHIESNKLDFVFKPVGITEQFVNIFLARLKKFCFNAKPPPHFPFVVAVARKQDASGDDALGTDILSFDIKNKGTGRSILSEFRETDKKDLRYIAMQKYDGSMAKLMGTPEWTESVALDAMNQVRDALVLLHHYGVAMNDLKPANIFYEKIIAGGGATYKWYLADWGSALLTKDLVIEDSYQPCLSVQEGPVTGPSAPPSGTTAGVSYWETFLEYKLAEQNPKHVSGSMPLKQLLGREQRQSYLLDLLTPMQTLALLVTATFGGTPLYLPWRSGDGISLSTFSIEYGLYGPLDDDSLTLDFTKRDDIAFLLLMKRIIHKLDINEKLEMHNIFWPGQADWDQLFQQPPSKDSEFFPLLTEAGKSGLPSYSPSIESIDFSSKKRRSDGGGTPPVEKRLSSRAGREK